MNVNDKATTGQYHLKDKRWKKSQFLNIWGL